jgi:hypothetical protein
MSFETTAMNSQNDGGPFMVDENSIDLVLDLPMLCKMCPISSLRRGELARTLLFKKKFVLIVFEGLW